MNFKFTLPTSQVRLEFKQGVSFFEWSDLDKSILQETLNIFQSEADCEHALNPEDITLFLSYGNEYLVRVVSTKESNRVEKLMRSLLEAPETRKTDFTQAKAIIMVVITKTPLSLDGGSSDRREIHELMDAVVSYGGYDVYASTQSDSAMHEDEMSIFLVASGIKINVD